MHHDGRIQTHKQVRDLPDCAPGGGGGLVAATMSCCGSSAAVHARLYRFRQTIRKQKLTPTLVPSLALRCLLLAVLVSGEWSCCKATGPSGSREQPTSQPCHSSSWRVTCAGLLLVGKPCQDSALMLIDAVCHGSAVPSLLHGCSRASRASSG